MTRKKRRQKKLILTLSVLIAALPVSLSLFCKAGQDLPASVSFFDAGPNESNTNNSSKILPVLANK
jgi:hypothetical protein